MKTFPIITKTAQKEFEHCAMGTSVKEEIPCICGYYGRVCRQMEKEEGANRALCMGCPLAVFVAECQC